MVRTLFREEFQARCRDSRLNTSYPLSPADWMQFRVSGPLPFDEKALSFYVHIPFCRHLCSFCEYTSTLCPDKVIQLEYIRALRNDILTWVEGHKGIELKGFDIGGGTPTALEEEPFRALMDLFTEVKSAVSLSSDFEPSIEGTFQTVSKDKLNAISSVGINRISIGLQAANGDVLRKSARGAVSLNEAMRVRTLVSDSGIGKLNIDLMYGLNGKTAGDGRVDLEWIRELHPEQVTLYEFRPNMLNGSFFADADERYAQYDLLYEGLMALGFFGEFGANTFSIDKDDLGVSSYLRSRMCKGTAYKGFGLSAQSMSSHGISYNSGKGAKYLSGYLGNDSFPEEFTYILPREELLAKFICISAYYGRFSMTAASAILGRDYYEEQKDILHFLQQEEQVTVLADQVAVTEKGFKHYGAVFSLLGCLVDGPSDFGKVRNNSYI